MKLVLLIAVLVVSFRLSRTLTNQAYIDVISSIENTAEDLVGVIVNVDRSSVTLDYYNQSSIDDYIVSFTLDDTSALESVFDSTKETFYTVHGFVSTDTSPINTLIKNAVLGRYDVNYFIVNWPAYSGYVYAYKSVPYVGKYLGEFINNVSATYNYSNSNVKLAGHSLGAHICGIAGNGTNGTVGSILGMDPAGPLYNLDNDTSTRLSQYDGLNVQAIHTNSDLYGITFSVGRSDFWANGGSSQPGCNVVTNLASCSHRRSFQLYAESVTSGGFDAIKCRRDTTLIGTTNYDDCNPLEIVYMGGYDLDESAEGDYFLTTNDEEPYALGTLGTEFNTTS